MFGVGSQEILVILLVVLLLFGGKRIPEVARALGKGMGDFRRAVREVQREVDLELLKPPETRPAAPERPVVPTGQVPPAAAQAPAACKAEAAPDGPADENRRR